MIRPGYVRCRLTVAEFVASDSGLGYLLLGYNGNMNTSMTFAVIVVLSALGLLLYGLVELVERWAIPWHVSQRRDALTLGRNPTKDEATLAEEFVGDDDPKAAFGRWPQLAQVLLLSNEFAFVD